VLAEGFERRVLVDGRAALGRLNVEIVDVGDIKR
jgi:hypothetical protein